MYMFRLVFFVALCSGLVNGLPVFVSTWEHGYNCSRIAYELYTSGTPLLDAVEQGISQACELNFCSDGVGPYGKVDEEGHLTLDAMLMDGTTLEVGAVGGLRDIRTPISVARAVMKYTTSTFLVGPQATQFAVDMGFQTSDLRTAETNQTWQDWMDDQCQPNFRKDVEPDPLSSCGPYSPVDDLRSGQTQVPKMTEFIDHDTVNTIGVDQAQVVVGTTTNGLLFKIPGRVGDSPIPGAGSYADTLVGGAAATGNGDILLRLLPSYQTVENMRQGMGPEEAARESILRVLRYYPGYTGAVIAANIQGEYGAACMGYNTFPFSVMSSDLSEVEIIEIPCEDANL